jgi:hypothetical protein
LDGAEHSFSVAGQYQALLDTPQTALIEVTNEFHIGIVDFVTYRFMGKAESQGYKFNVMEIRGKEAGDSDENLHTICTAFAILN